MFEPVINQLKQTQAEFDAKIQDSFGRSIDEKVFEPMEIDLGKLEMASNEAELKMQEINAITWELRTLI